MVNKLGILRGKVVDNLITVVVYIVFIYGVKVLIHSYPQVVHNTNKF